MFSLLTVKQKVILECPDSRIVVKACPGSGKTFSVAARLARLLNESNHKHTGIAVISFTKVAADEIRKTLAENYGITKIEYPHFIGTIDSFINQHIFYPFGHLLMKCDERPEIVGTEFNQWYEYDNSLTKHFRGKVSFRDPNYYFDKVSFDFQNKPISLLPPSVYHFSWDWTKLTNKNGSLNKKIRDIIDAKWNHFNNGKANQADANYFSLRLLNEFPLILEILIKKYSHIIVDEAQDTTHIQMSIIDVLDIAGAMNIMLVGDPDQSIFEWNTADAELFMNKYRDERYSSIELNENRRSSTNICSVLNKMVSSDTTSISDVKNDTNIPEVIGYEQQGIQQVKEDFISKCDELGINVGKSAILFRGKKFGEDHFQLTDENQADNTPWKNGDFFVRDIVFGKYLIEKGYYKQGLKLLEKGFHKLKTPALSYVSKSYINTKIAEIGFRCYRKELFDFIHLLPEIAEKDISSWVTETNTQLQTKGFSILDINRRKANVRPSSLFHSTERSEFPFEIGTIHSVKGQTFDAVLLFITKKAVQTNYSTILSNLPQADKKQIEEMRVIYVACSRPKRLLWIAVPSEDQVIWRNYIGPT